MELPNKYRSRPYITLDPLRGCCEACVFHSGEHSPWCKTNIKTENQNPPIPGGPYWLAWVDGEEDGLTGSGDSEDQAISDLQEKIIEAYL